MSDVSEEVRATEIEEELRLLREVVYIARAVGYEVDDVPHRNLRGCVEEYDEWVLSKAKTDE
tara:strand:+ start:967 stop:1152 length:186 start_codon:yes stop_codon:yes gene_type:complete